LLLTLLIACGSRTTTDSAGGDVGLLGTGATELLNIYAATGANALSPVAARARPLVYVPNARGASVTVIDPKTYTVVRTFRTGKVPQHVVPSYDETRLWVANNSSNSLTPIDPVTGDDGPPVKVDDPYNLYFTPDGRYALVVAEKLHRLDFRDPGDMHLVQSLPVECRGIDHMEFTADGRYAIATCEYSGQLVKIDLAQRAVVGYLVLDPGRWYSFKSAVTDFVTRRRHRSLEGPSMPQDIRSTADGKVFYVADMQAGGVYTIDPVTFTRTGFIETGVGTHGIYPSRDGKLLYVTNRGWTTLAGGRHGPGSVSVVDPAQEKVVATWPIPGGGSPDMGNVTADGRELWISGRYDDEVYVFDTRTGQLTHRIPVGREPHGLCVWPQPGRYSLGHTGNMR
jgi:YVTN family beta-propeller protein